MVQKHIHVSQYVYVPLENADHVARSCDPIGWRREWLGGGLQFEAGGIPLVQEAAGAVLPPRAVRHHPGVPG